MIKNLIFDFGDVFINLDKQAIEREFAKFGISQITDEMLDWANQYEKGLVDTGKITNYFCGRFPNTTNAQFRHAWNAIILDFPDYRLEFIENLSKQKTFNLILLSNTNALHIEKVIEIMSIERFNRFKNCFNQFYLSHEIQLNKPNAEIFEFVLNENKIKAKECLFIDDTLEHTITASRLGISTWHINPKNQDIVDLFKTKKELF